MAPKTLTSLPSEIRQQIFRESLKVDGGYVYDIQTDKLTNPDGTAIDLSLLYTCRSIANDTRAMPLAVNTIRFSTIFRQDWCNLAGCFALAATTHYVLEQDFVFHLAHFITPDMLAELELICPGFEKLLEIELVEHETWIHENEDPEYYFQTVSSRPAVCSMVRQFMKKVDLFKINGKSLSLPFRLLHNEADANVTSNSFGNRKTEWTQGELREAISYCLKLISEAQPDEFATYVYNSLPHWVGSRPAKDFINLRFNLWDIPSQERVAQMLELFEIGAFVWDLPATWYYTPHSFYDQVGKGFPPQDRRSPEFENPDNLLEHFTRRCREKLRFSATAAAIRFLQRLPISQRKRMRNIVLHEDLPSVNLASRHTQGLIPFLKENPLLRVERRASVFGCIGSQRPYNIFAHMDSEEGEGVLSPPVIVDQEFESSIYYWLLDAFTVVDSGIDTNCFTFVLEAGQHSDYCSEIFQKVIQEEISKSKAWKICLDTGLLSSVRPSTREDNTTRYAKDPRFEKLVGQLVNQASTFRCDFNPGAPLDVDALVEDAKLRHGENIFDKWVSKGLFEMIPLPHDLYHDVMVAPNWEFQTRQEYIESRRLNTGAEES
ncbi:hypothetical protein FNAPI_9494 [Fusarium napiforme]|uniref:Uncharacterized protein n=1 Tax=Fusarium napiforme TaxID=42672 RepID=A0A8H5IW49_9HYPO|nr:hypothetical protein FNAPI_9494 [Fusarium napiforme]